MNIQRKERGQALIIIALAAVGLFAFTSLAIDGSMVFSKKRQAQNAADAAALAGALALVREVDDPTLDPVALAYESTVQNAFNNDTTTNEVDVYNPPIDGPYAGDDQYVQVKILVHVTTYFTRVIGRNNVDTAVEAVARATIPEVVPWHEGDALVSLMPGCRTPGQSDDPFVVIGNADIDVTGAGIRVNSNCTRTGQVAYDQGGHSEVTTDAQVCVFGAYRAANTTPPPENCPPSDNGRYQLPNPFCSHEGQVVDLGSNNYIAIPGNYSGTFPGVSPAGTLKLQKGIYCLHDGFELHSSWTVTSDLNDNDLHDSLSEGVFFFVDGGDITFNGNSYIEIHAIDVIDDDFPEEFVNFLFYVPPSNPANIKLTGSNGSQFTGTILAPSSSTEILGNNATLALNSQIISYTVKVSGGGNLRITYNQDENGLAWTNPGVEMVE
jgi:hypothetical protein